MLLKICAAYFLLIGALVLGYLTYVEGPEQLVQEVVSEVRPVPKITKVDNVKEIVNNIQKLSPQLSIQQATRYANIIYSECSIYNLDPKVIVAMMFVESSLNKEASSYKGAKGLMQLMPATADWMLTIPEINIRLGVCYLSMMEKKFGNLDKAIIAYNRGPVRLKRELAKGNIETGYLDRVMDYYSQLSEGG